MNRTIQMAMVMLAVGCSSGASVSLSARGGPSTSSAASANPNALTLSNGIVIDRVRVVISDVKLESAAGAAALDVDAGTAAVTADDHEDGEDEIHTGPVVLDLSGAALDGTVQTVTDASLTPGTYSEIRFKIHKVLAAESTDAALKAMSDAGASIIVDGTIDGAAFSFVSSIEAQQKFEGSFNLSANNNLTINVDETNWFGSATARLDPRVEANRSQIENNIKASLRAFRDNDRDGHDD
ncbi:MAG TPA: hypothetical protein VGH20_02235 [Myxococcales bacterium]